jgi:hypothetical protein
MMNRAAGSREDHERRRWPTPSILLAGAAVFVVLGGSAVAASGLIRARDIAPGAVASKAIRDGAVEPRDLSAGTRAFFAGQAAAGEQGDTGLAGAPGSNGANGANGPNGANGVDGVDGIDGSDGTNGTNGINGTIAPLSATKGLTPLPTASPPVTVVELAIPAGNYVVLAKTQLSHSGAGDSVECTLKAGASTIDQIAMKTLPALAAIPASLQAVTTTTTSPTVLSVQCRVLVADGAANFSSLIAIPTA